MTDKEAGGEVHELAGGWITERKATPLPGFLKLAYIGFSVFGIAYLFLYVKGEVGHATRGPLVQQLNAATDAPGTAWIAFIAAVLVTFVAGLLWYALAAKTED